MKVFAKFDEIPSKILQDTKETKCNRHTEGRKDGRMDRRTYVKTVYPPTNTVCGGIKILEDRNVFARFDEIPSMIL